LTLKQLGAIPAKTAPVVGKGEDDAGSAREVRLLGVFSEHAPHRVFHQRALEPRGRILDLFRNRRKISSP
jgi:hypothetical protein